MVDPKKAAKLIRQHFEELTTEQFVENLHSLSHEVHSDTKSKKQTQELLQSSTTKISPVEK